MNAYRQQCHNQKIPHFSPIPNVKTAQPGQVGWAVIGPIQISFRGGRRRGARLLVGAAVCLVGALRYMPKFAAPMRRASAVHDEPKLMKRTNRLIKCVSVCSPGKAEMGS
jgi:hypothetical protein